MATARLAVSTGLAAVALDAVDATPVAGACNLVSLGVRRRRDVVRVGVVAAVAGVVAADGKGRVHDESSISVIRTSVFIQHLQSFDTVEDRAERAYTDVSN